MLADILWLHHFFKMKTIIIAIFLIFYLSSNGQVHSYSKFINEHSINKKQTVKTDDGKEDIIYLGKIKNKGGKNLFYILTIYSEVQAAIEIHGHSNVIYLGNNKVFKKQFELGSPQDLPFKLENNNLYFNYLNSKTKKKELYVNHVGKQIPKLLCVGPDDCY